MRFESVQDGSATSMDEITMIVLASTMFISILLYFDFIKVFAKERLVLFTAEKHSTTLD